MIAAHHHPPPELTSTALRDTSTAYLQSFSLPPEFQPYSRVSAILQSFSHTPEFRHTSRAYRQSWPATGAQALFSLPNWASRRNQQTMGVKKPGAHRGRAWCYSTLKILKVVCRKIRTNALSHFRLSGGAIPAHPALHLSKQAYGLNDFWHQVKRVLCLLHMAAAAVASTRPACARTTVPVMLRHGCVLQRSLYLLNLVHFLLLLRLIPSEIHQPHKGQSASPPGWLSSSCMQ